VPLLLVHGERDDDVPVHISREFAEAARAAGDDCELVVVDDESHYEHLEPGSRCWGAVIEWLSR
jgi:dipeptidyl aminopeptidase/acylaminoacyl peptidase